MVATMPNLPNNRVNTSINVDGDVADAVRLVAAAERSNFSAKLNEIARAHFDRVGWPEVARKGAKRKRTPAAAK